MTTVGEAPTPAGHSTAGDCPGCGGRGQITGPKSVAYDHDPSDPFNREVRLCDECEGTSVVTAIRRAGLDAESMQRVMDVVDKMFPDGAIAARQKGRDLAQEMGL